MRACLETGWTLDEACSRTLDELRLVAWLSDRMTNAALLLQLQVADFPHLKKASRVKIVERLKAGSEVRQAPSMSIEEFIKARLKPSG